MGEYNAAYDRFMDSPEKFWSEIAGELDWFKEWDEVLEWNHPKAKWFTGAKCNITHNCLDRHLATRGDQVAIIWEGNEPGEEKGYTDYPFLPN